MVMVVVVTVILVVVVTSDAGGDELFDSDSLLHAMATAFPCRHC
jgi:hypothetical protein